MVSNKMALDPIPDELKNNGEKLRKAFATSWYKLQIYAIFYQD